MNLLDKIDAAVFRVVDSFVLWCWDELGVKYASLATSCFGVSTVLLIAQQSEWGAKYSAAFWVFAGGMGVVSFFVITRLHVLPAELISAQNIGFRTTILARGIRYMWVAFGLTDLSDRRYVAMAVATIVALLVLDAAVPTKPRNKKRREVLNRDLAYSRT